MAWQPLPPTHPNVSDERLIATGGEDCAIFVWNAKVPDSKPKCSLTLQQPIVRLAFTPDGAFLAAATSSQVLIWKVGNFAVPRAMWSRPSHSGWLSPKANSDSEEEDEHCLCWDASGHKLAYGSNSRVSSASSVLDDENVHFTDEWTLACCHQLQQIDYTAAQSRPSSRNIFLVYHGVSITQDFWSYTASLNRGPTPWS